MVEARADQLLGFLICLFGGACLCVSYLTLRKGREAASFGLIFCGLLTLLVGGVYLLLTTHLPD